MMDKDYSKLDFQQFSNILTSMAASGRMRYLRLLFRVFNLVQEPRAATTLSCKNVTSRGILLDDDEEFAMHMPAPSIDPFVERAVRFAELCLKVRDEHDKESEKELKEMLQELFQDKRFVSALMTLLRKADSETIRQFADSYLGQDMAQYVTVDIVIRRNDNLERMTGNIGHYLIYTRKGEDGEEKLLRFTNQASTVYYLMFLISRCQQEHPAFVELAKNRDLFLELYRQVYDEHETTLVYKYDNLLRREDRYGQHHAGRLHEIVYDIRKHLAYRFDEYDETFLPYAMTAREHLTVSPDHIYFEGDAAQLLLLQFV